MSKDIDPQRLARALQDRADKWQGKARGSPNAVVIAGTTAAVLASIASAIREATK